MYTQHPGLIPNCFSHGGIQETPANEWKTYITKPTCKLQVYNWGRGS